MKEKTTISTIKQSALLTFPTEDEIVVAQILLDLPSMTWAIESRSNLEWGSKRRRSIFNNSSLSPSLQKVDIEIEVRQPPPKAAAEQVAATASPVTPLAFWPSESDEKSRHAFNRSSRKRSREKYIDLIEELTHRRDLLREEIGNVTKYYEKLVAYNTKLKVMKHEVLNSYQRKEEPEEEIIRNINLGVELAQHHDIIVEQPQPFNLGQMAEKLQHLIGPTGAHFHSSYNGLGSGNHVDPLGIPDLNISFGETFRVDPYQPLDMRSEFTDKRARFSEARRRRMDIIKIKSMRSACGIKFARTR